MSPNFHTDCFYNLSRPERLDIFQRREGLRIELMFRNYFGWLMLPFSLLGCIITFLFLKTVFQAIRDRRVSRKCYILIFNRSIGDLVSCVVAVFVCAYVILMPEVNRDFVTLVESLIAGSFWSAMVSYVALSVIKLFAVWKPFHYRKCFTMQRCVHLIILSWVVFIIMVSYTVIVDALVKIPKLADWSGCKVETCLSAMYISRNYVTVGVYFFTIFVFLGTVLLIRRARRGVSSSTTRDSGKSDGGRVQEKVRFPFWKISLNVATFAGLYLFYVIWAISLSFMDRCFWQRNYVEMMTLLAAVRCSLMVRILVDPIISYVTDLELRRVFGEMFGVGVGTTTSSRRFQKNTVSSGYDSSLRTQSAGGITREVRSPTVRTMP